MPELLLWDFGPYPPGVQISVDPLIFKEQLNQVCSQYGGLSKMLKNNQDGEASHRLPQGGGFLRGSLKAYLFLSFFGLFAAIYHCTLKISFPSGSNKEVW